MWRAVSLIDARTSTPVYVATTAYSSSQASDDAVQQQEAVVLGLASSADPSATSSVDTVAMIGPMVMAQLAGQYMGMQDSGSYSAQAGEQAAQDIAGNIRATISYKVYGVSDIKTDTDTSYARMLTYRSDLREALAPLLKNTSPELELFARYIETSDPIYLTRLTEAAQNYRSAIANVALVVVPRDAVNYDRSILNAMGQFAGTLDQMATHGTDTLASAALLRAYNTAEQDMYTSFNALSAYYGQKTP